jgi:hypothetical protein
MSNPGKIRGTRWESQIVDYLRRKGALYVERRALGGAKDRGDISGLPGVVIEAKNAAKILLSSWLDEANTERDNDGARFGVAWFHRSGRADPGKGYVVMDGDTFVDLLRCAGYFPPEAPSPGSASTAPGDANNFHTAIH